MCHTHNNALTTHAAKFVPSQENDAKATFFIIGAEAQAYPRQMAAIVAEGHEVGNHMWEDKPTYKLSPASFAREVAEMEELLAAHRPQRTQRRWFRRARAKGREMLRHALRVRARLASC